MMAQRHIARATARKIDAIEFEMSRDMVRPRVPSSPPTVVNVSDNQVANTEDPGFSPSAGFASTIPLEGSATDYLLDHTTDMLVTEIGETASVPLLEEAAILFASGQTEVSEQMLISAIEENQLGAAEPFAWYMLFDLYQIARDQDRFEQLALDYASKFETSPPIWHDDFEDLLSETQQVRDRGIGSLNFPSDIDASIIKLIERLNTLALKNRCLQLDFSRAKRVDPVGCGLLLRAIKNLKKSGHDLVLIGAQEFADKIRQILQVGRRDETEAPWLLLLEILQLLNSESVFEEVSMDYCITFEVSPPAFEAPKIK